MPRLSHLNSWIPTKCNLYLANSLATVVSEPDLYMLLTFQVPNLLFLFHCLGHKVSVQFQVVFMFRISARFYFEKLSAPPPTPKQVDHPLFFLSATTYPIYSKLPSILEAVSSSAARAHAMLRWQGPPYHFLKWCWYLTLRRLMSYIYGAPILDVSRSHTTTQHSR